MAVRPRRAPLPAPWVRYRKIRPKHSPVSTARAARCPWRRCRQNQIFPFQSPPSANGTHKSEIRIAKTAPRSETNGKENSNSQIGDVRVWNLVRFEHLDLFRISSFGFVFVV